MSEPVERWLETFNCRQYAEIIERSGYDTLQKVCQLTPATLSAMGITSTIDIEKIMENVSVLRQTLQIGTQNNYPPTYDSYTPLNTIETSTPVPPTKAKKGLKSQKSASSIDGSTAKGGKNSTPNVTIANNKSNSRSYKNKGGANTEAAKQIASDFLQMSKNQNVNTGYTYVELSTLQNKIHQPQYQQYDKVNNNNPMGYKQPYEGSYNDSWGNYNQNQVYSNSPLESLERLVALPETQVIDPKSVVNDADSHHITYEYNTYHNQNKRVNMNDDNLPAQYANSDSSKKLCTMNNNSQNNLQQPIIQMQPQQQMQNLYAQNNNQYYDYNNSANTYYAPMNQYPPPQPQQQQQQQVVAPMQQVAIQQQHQQPTNQYYNQSQYNQVPYQDNSYSSYQIEPSMGQITVDYGQNFSNNSGYMMANGAALQQPYVNQYDQQNQQYYSY